jgi:surfactin synthase thioesterase subunit
VTAWVVPWHPSPAGRPTLVCAPPGGSGCNRFRGWQARLGLSVSVVGVQLPGRENRFAEEHPATFAEAVTAVAADLAELRAGAPLVIVGESFGGLLAYELARATGPDALVLAATEPPGNRSAAEHLVIDERILRDLFVSGPPELRDLDEDSQEFLLDVLRRDDKLADTHVLAEQFRVDCPIHAWSGDLDAVVPGHLLDGWAGYSTAGTTRRSFAGSHTFLTDLADETVPALGSLLC